MVKNSQWCLNCHAPLQNQQPLIVDGISTLRPPTVSGQPNPDFDPALQAEGVTCVVCHQKESAIRAPQRCESPSRRGLRPNPVESG